MRYSSATYADLKMRGGFTKRPPRPSNSEICMYAHEAQQGSHFGVKIRTGFSAHNPTAGVDKRVGLVCSSQSIHFHFLIIDAGQRQLLITQIGSALLQNADVLQELDRAVTVGKVSKVSIPTANAGNQMVFPLQMPTQRPRSVTRRGRRRCSTSGKTSTRSRTSTEPSQLTRVSSRGFCIGASC